MRVISILFIMVIIICIGVVPWVDGYLFKQNYLNLLKTLSSENNHIIKILDYRQGWLGSYAKLYIEPLNYKTADQTKPAKGMIIEQTITHGPFLYDRINNQWEFARAEIQSDVSFPGALQTVLVNQTDQSDLHAITVVNLAGDYISQVQMPAFVLKNIPGLKNITWYGLGGILTAQVVNNRAKRLTGDFIIGALVIQINDAESIRSNEITFQYDTDLQSLGIWNGRYDVGFLGVAINNVNGFDALVNGLNVTNAFGVDKNNFYNNSIRFSLNKLQVGDLLVNPSTVSLAVNHLNVQGLVGFINEVSAVKTAEVSQENLQKMSELFPSLLSPSSTINEVVKIETSAGRLESNGKVFWPEGHPLPKTAEEFMANVNFQINIRVSISLVNKVIELLYNDHSVQEKPTLQSVINSEVQSTPSVPTEQSLIAHVDALSHDNQIALDVSFQLKDLIYRHLPLDVFVSNIDQYVLKKEMSSQVAEQLKSEYAVLNPKGKLAPPPLLQKPKPVQPMSVPSVPPKNPSMEIAKQMLQNWIKQGLLVQEDGDYVTNIVRQ